MVNFNPTCYLPTSFTSALVPSFLACPPPPSPLQTFYQTFTSPLSATYTTLRAGMDALLSLPLLSFLLIPTMTSYSTSLNLLFFYLTWSTLVLSHPPLRVEVVACLAVKVLFYVLPSALFLTFDLLFPGVSEAFKSLGSTALPLKNLSRRRAPRQLKVLGWSLFNVLVLGIACQAGIEYALVNMAGGGGGAAGAGRKSALRVTTTLPLPWAILKDLLRGLLARDLLTWCVHRYLLHNPRANNITRDLSHLHATWYHAEVRAPFPLSATYDHPLIYILRVFLPLYLPAWFWRFHLLTYIVYLLLISLEETFTHSGYTSLPTNFILGGIARRNDMHCLTGGEGNYGTWGVVDWLVGTNIGGDVAEDVLMEVEEAAIQDKIERKMKGAARKVRGPIVRDTFNGDDDANDSGEYRRRRSRSRRHDADADAGVGIARQRRRGTSTTDIKKRVRRAVADATRPSPSHGLSSGTDGRTRSKRRSTTTATTTTTPAANTRRKRRDDDSDYED